MILLWCVLWCRVLVVRLCNSLNRLLAKSLRAEDETLFFGCSCRHLDVVKTSTVAVETSWPLCYVDLVLSHTHKNLSSPWHCSVLQVAMSYVARCALHLKVEAVLLTSCTPRYGMQWWPKVLVLVWDGHMLAVDVFSKHCCVSIPRASSCHCMLAFGSSRKSTVQFLAVHFAWFA